MEVVFDPLLLLLLMTLDIFSFREAGSSLRKTGWKPYGTPLVSPISCDDVVTRGDIQSVVYTMLSPMLRTDNLHTNTSATTSDPPPAVNCTEASTESNIADSKQESGNSKLPTAQKLPLQLVDENNACIDLSVGEEKTVKFSSSSISILVFVDWSQKLLDNYETSYLENLPEVLKYGTVTKKSRSEPLSLYTCLEAFLREEPLVPEDMWLVSSSFLH